MNIKKITIAILLALFSCISVFSAASDDLLVNQLKPDRLKYFPVPEDNKNYFFLQSIKDRTQILIGDFTLPEKKIVLITLNKDFNTIKSVTEYYPVTNELRTLKKSESKFFTTDVNRLKNDIISGAIYQNNYADPMKSLPVLEDEFERGDAGSVVAYTYGFTVKHADVDDRKKPSAMFGFGKTEKGYYMSFKTEFYRESFASTRIPILKYSVYCKDTNDPVIKETVDKLFKIKEPSALRAK